MPTATGGETIGERLLRLRVDLVRVRETIQRSESNGQSFGVNSSSVSQIAYESALVREKKLMREIHKLELRLAGVKRTGVAVTVTKMD